MRSGTRPRLPARDHVIGWNAGSLLSPLIAFIPQTTDRVGEAQMIALLALAVSRRLAQGSSQSGSWTGVAGVIGAAVLGWPLRRPGRPVRMLFGPGRMVLERWQGRLIWGARRRSEA